jgi:hypothetical protein
MHGSATRPWKAVFAFDYLLGCRPSLCPPDLDGTFRSGTLLVATTADDVCNSVAAAASEPVLTLQLQLYSDVSLAPDTEVASIKRQQRIWVKVVST